jgi:hypothetical protein
MERIEKTGERRGGGEGRGEGRGRREGKVNKRYSIACSLRKSAQL